MIRNRQLTGQNRRDSFLDSRLRWSSLLWQAFAGLLFGYAVLHPVSMVVFHWLDPRIAAAMPNGTSMGPWAPIAHSFAPDMLPMALVFAGIGAAITTFYGYHRLALTFQRDRLEEELARNERLRAELAEQAEQLRQSNEELAKVELANRRATQFMTHDFKTALSCVGGFTSELLEKPHLREYEDVLDALARIRRQTHRMMGSVTDLLEFARAREGNVPQMKPISVAELLHDAVSDFSLPAHTERIEVGDGHTSCPALWGDPRLLRRVLCNLISNAIKHNGPGTRVSLDAKLGNCGGEAVLSCRDDGAGIPPEVLPTIFTEFATTGNALSGSTGLGLAFCRSAVEAHGGRIWCENSPQGAQFFLTIPLHERRDDER